MRLREREDGKRVPAGGPKRSEKRAIVLKKEFFAKKK
jgi:hypothetical protein